MSKFELTREERQLLLEILETALSELRVEIVSTERLDFKSALKHRKETLGNILEKFQKADKLTEFS